MVAGHSGQFTSSGYLSTLKHTALAWIEPTTFRLLVRRAIISAAETTTRYRHRFKNQNSIFRYIDIDISSRDNSACSILFYSLVYLYIDNIYMSKTVLFGTGIFRNFFVVGGISVVLAFIRITYLLIV